MAKNLPPGCTQTECDMNQPGYWDDDEPLDEEEEFLAEAEANCHMHADGQCGAAGSEYCDFECPFRDGRWR